MDNNLNQDKEKVVIDRNYIKKKVKSFIPVLLSVCVVIAIIVSTVLIVKNLTPIVPSSAHRLSISGHYDDRIESVAAYALSGAVEITASGVGLPSVGSGFIVGKQYKNNPIIVTNYHVISRDGGDPYNMIQIRLVDKAAPFSESAKIMCYDKQMDIAVLTLNINLQDIDNRIMQWADSRKLKYGQPVVAIGNALGNGTSITAGEISMPELIKNLEINNKQVTRHLIMTSAAINEGNSGGMLVDMDGKVVGVNTFKIMQADNTEADNMGLAIPSNTARAIVDYAIRNYEKSALDASTARILTNKVNNLTTETFGFNNLKLEMDKDYNNIISLKNGFNLMGTNMYKGEQILSVYGIDINRLNFLHSVPSRSIFYDLELYFTTDTKYGNINKFYVATDRGQKTFEIYLIKETDWMQELRTSSAA